VTRKHYRVNGASWAEQALASCPCLRHQSVGRQQTHTRRRERGGVQGDRVRKGGRRSHDSRGIHCGHGSNNNPTPLQHRHTTLILLVLLVLSFVFSTTPPVCLPSSKLSVRCRSSTKTCSFLPRKSIGLHTPYDPKFNSLFFFYQKTRVSKKLLAVVLYVVLYSFPSSSSPLLLPSFLAWRMLCFFLLRRFSANPLEAAICPNCSRATDLFISELVWHVPLAQVLPRPQLIFPSKTWFFGI
jgi:hypothetical protein